MTNYHLEARSMLYKKYTEEFNEIHKQFKKLHPVDKSQPYGEVTRHITRVRNYALAELMERHVVEYKKILDILAPNTRRNAVKTWQIKVYTDKYAVVVNNKVLLTSNDFNQVLKWLKENVLQ